MTTSSNHSQQRAGLNDFTLENINLDKGNKQVNEAECLLLQRTSDIEEMKSCLNLSPSRIKPLCARHIVIKRRLTGKGYLLYDTKIIS